MNNSFETPLRYARMAFLEKNLKFKTEKPYLYLLPTDGSFPETNCTFKTSKVQITDLRSSTLFASFETDGFTALQRPLREKNLWTIVQGWKEPTVEPRLLEYLEETRNLLQDHFKADKVICFDWRVFWTP